MALLCALALVPAHAAGKGGATDDVQTIGIASVDAVFAEIGDIDDTLDGVQKALRQTRLDLNNALSIQVNTPLAQALSVLEARGEGRLSVAMLDGVPTLEAAKGAPREIRDAVEAVNGLTMALDGVRSDLARLPRESRQLASALEDLPNALGRDLARTDLSALDLLGAIAAIEHNAQLIAGLPGRAQRVSQRALGLVELVGDLRFDAPAKTSGPSKKERTASKPATDSTPKRTVSRPS